METAEELQAIFARHWEAFLRDVNALQDTPENRERIKVAMQAFFESQHKDEHKAKGLGAVIAEHWEALMPLLLRMCDSEQKKEQLMEAFTRLLTEQVLEFSRILTSEVEAN